MKRNFLLMLLLTLLPTAIFAATYNNVSVTWTPNSTSATFTGGAMALPVPTLRSGGSNLPANAYTVTWKYNGGSTVTVADHAGTYTATITATTGNTINYAWGASNSHTYTVDRAANTISAPSFPDGSSWKYGETPNAPSSTTTDGTATYQYSLNGSTWLDWPVPTNTKPGTYSVRAQVAQTVDYNAATSATSTFTIEKAPVTVTLGNVSYEWRDPWANPTMAEITESVSGGGKTWDMIKDNFNWNQLETVGNVGNYDYSLTVNASGAADEYFEYIVSGTGTLNVTQTTNTINSVTVATWTYGDAVADATDKITVDAKYGAETATFEFFDDGTSLGDVIPTDAGTKYSVKVTIPETVNYKETTFTKDFTIVKATIASIADLTTGAWKDYFTVPAAVTDELTYTEDPAGTPKEQTLETAVVMDPTVFADANITYIAKYSDNTTAYGGAGAAKAYKADTYKLTFWIKNAKNFNDFELPDADAITKVINKADLDLVDEDDLATFIKTSLEYTGSNQKLLISEAPWPEFKGMGRNGVFTYYIDGVSVGTNWEDVVGKDADEVNPTKYAITYTFVPDNKNFNSITEQKPIGNANIAKAFVKRTGSPAVVSGLTYNADDQKLLQTGKYFSGIEGGHVIYYAQGTKETDATEFTTYSDVKKKNNDTYTVSYKFFADDDNHKDDEDVTEIGSVLIDKYEVMVVGNEVKGTIEELYDLTAEPVAPKFANAQFLEDITLFGPDNANRTEILNAIVTPNIPAFDDLKLGDNTVTFTATPEAENNTNYKAKVVGTAGGRLKIESIEAAIQTAPEVFAGAEQLTFNGDDQELVKTAAVGYKAEAGTGTVAIGKVVYSLTGEDGSWTDDATAIVGKNAGDYKVYYNVELDEKTIDRFYEYTAGVKNLPVTIAKKNLADEMFVLTPTEAEYNGNNQLPVITTKAGEPIEDTDYYTEFADGNGKNIPNYGIEGVENADIYTITFKAEDDGNYTGTASATWTITKADATCEAPVAAELTYNGKDQALVAEPTYDGGTLEYSLDGTNWAEEIPTGKNADTYEVYYRVVADGNHNDFTCTDPVEVTIAPKALTRDLFVFENTPAENPTQDFTGEVLKFEYAVVDAEADILTASDYVCDKDDVIVDAGDYDFTFTGKENYTGTFTVTCTVAPIEQNVVAPTAINLTYNGGEQVLVEAGSTDAIAGSTAQPAGVVEYQVLFDGDIVVDWTSELAEVVGTNAGVYTVKSRAIASEVNYTNPKVENSVDVEILKANIGYMLSNIEKTWNGETFSAEEVEKLFTLYAGELKGNDVYDVPFTLNLPEDYKDAGTYTFKQPTVTFKDGYPVNYKVNFSGTAEVVIDKKDIEDADFTAPVANELTFNGADQALVEAGEVTTEYEENAIGTVLYATAEDGEYTETIPVGKDAGEYSVWYYVQGDKNHNDTEATEIAVTIAPKIWDAVLAFEDATGEDALLYNTKDQMPNTELKDDKTALEKGKDYTLVIAYTPANETGPLAGFEPKELINVGKYEFTYTGINNYEGATAKRTIEIAPADLAENVTMSKFEATKVYNAKDQKPAITLTYEGYTLEADKDFTVVAADEMINAGEYEFVFTAVAGGNYTGEAKATFEIEKKEAIAEAADATKVYDGTDAFEDLPVLTFKNIELADDPATAFTYEADAFVFDELSSNVGTYAFTVDVEKIESDNYYVSQANGANFTITPAKLMVNWNSEADPFTKVYGEKDPELKATTANLDITGAVAGEEEDIAAQTAITRAEGEAVGEYAITLAAAENAKVFDNYEVQFTGADAAFVITPATVKVSIATLEKVYDGEAATIDVKAEDLIVTGLQNGDKKEDIFTTLPTATVADGKAVNVGTYEVTLAGAVAGDYEVEYMTSTFNITPAKIITATIAKQQIQKGQDVEENIDATAFTIEGVIAADADKFYVTVNDKYQDMDGKVSASKGTYTDGLVIAVDEEVADNYEGYEKFFGDLLVLPAEATVIADNADWTIDKDTPAEAVTFTDRSINAGFWNVVALPFEASVAQISEAFGYAAVDVLNEAASDGNIHFQVISSGKVPAYTPFIVKTTEDEELIKNNFNEVVFYDVTLEAWPAAKNSVIKDAANNEFIGTFLANTEIPAKSQEYWYMSKGTWYDTMNRTKAVNLKAFRAYVHFDPANVAAGARIFIEEPDGTETAIDAVEFNNMVNGDTYTVDGMKVNKAQKGVYIQNGKKIAVK